MVDVKLPAARLTAMGDKMTWPRSLLYLGVNVVTLMGPFPEIDLDGEIGNDITAAF